MRKHLTDGQIRGAVNGGKHVQLYDQWGMFVRVRASGSAHFFQRLVIHGRRSVMALGTYPFMPLREAREQAMANKLCLMKGGDPRNRKSATVPSFRTVAETVIDERTPGWKDGGRSAGIWRSSLEAHIYPAFGSLPVDKVATADVLSAMLKIWHTKQETARKVLQRVNIIMAAAGSKGHRAESFDKDEVKAGLPTAKRTRTNHAAIPHARLGAALRKVRESAGAWPTTKACLEFIALTAVRSGEARAARWTEFDMDKDTWTVPAERTKTGKPHRVPLSGRAMEILRLRRTANPDSDLVFPSQLGKVLSDSTLSKLTRDLKLGFTPHGCRSSFRDWCGETGHPRELAEMQLAHVLPSVEGAYARSDLLERRRAVMEQWAEYLAQ